jgi:hypothetical protein
MFSQCVDHHSGGSFCMSLEATLPNKAVLGVRALMYRVPRVSRLNKINRLYSYIYFLFLVRSNPYVTGFLCRLVSYELS